MLVAEFFGFWPQVTRLSDLRPIGQILDANLDRALAALVDAGRIAEAMRDDRRANDCDAPAGIVERLRAMPICYGNPTDRVLAGLVGCTAASVRETL